MVRVVVGGQCWECRVSVSVTVWRNVPVSSSGKQGHFKERILKKSQNVDSDKKRERRSLFWPLLKFTTQTVIKTEFHFAAVSHRFICVSQKSWLIDDLSQVAQEGNIKRNAI